MDSPPVNSLGTDLVTSMKQAGESKTFDSQVSRGFPGMGSTGRSRMGFHKKCQGFVMVGRSILYFYMYYK